jgi:hypothetical protein
VLLATAPLQGASLDVQLAEAAMAKDRDYEQSGDADGAASDAITNALATSACDNDIHNQAIAAAMNAGADEAAAACIADKHLCLARARGAWEEGQSDLERQRPSETELGAAVSKDLLCSITNEVFVDPVMTEDGMTYERMAIERWFAVGNTTSPLTRKEIDPSILTADIAMKRRLAVDIYPFRMRAVVQDASTTEKQVDLLDLLGKEAMLRLLRGVLPANATTTDVVSRTDWRGKVLTTVFVRIGTVQVLQELRDALLTGDLARSLFEETRKHWLSLKNAVQGSSLFATTIAIDLSHFAEVYERSLLMMDELTPHQQQKLGDCLEPRELIMTGDVHLMGPAGSGKTFVALHLILQALTDDASVYILFVVKNTALAYFVAKWLWTRVSTNRGSRQAEVRQVMNRFHVLCGTALERASFAVEGGLLVRKEVTDADVQLRLFLAAHPAMGETCQNAMQSGDKDVTKQYSEAAQEWAVKEGVSAQIVYSLVVVDEAHDLADSAAKQIEKYTSQGAVLSLSKVSLAEFMQKHDPAEELDVDKMVKELELGEVSSDELFKMLVDDYGEGPEMLSIVPRLLLSDVSQASVFTADAVDMISSSSMTSKKDERREAKQVVLKEVVRSSARIVEGARVFQTNDDDEPTKCCHTADGPPVTTLLMLRSENETAEIRAMNYAVKVVEALTLLSNKFKGLSFHDRVAIIVPDTLFIDEIKPALEALVQAQGCNFRFVDVIATNQFIGGNSQDGAPQCIVLDMVDNFNGLERLIVIAVGLDSPIHRGGSKEAAQTRSRLYRAITRAQMVVVVNEVLRGGWLEFLSCVKFEAKAEFDAERERNMAVKAGSGQDMASTVVKRQDAAKTARDKTVAQQATAYSRSKVGPVDSTGAPGKKGDGKGEEEEPARPQLISVAVLQSTPIMRPCASIYPSVLAALGFTKPTKGARIEFEGISFCEEPDLDNRISLGGALSIEFEEEEHIRDDRALARYHHQSRFRDDGQKKEEKQIHSQVWDTSLSAGVVSRPLGDIARLGFMPNRFHAVKHTLEFKSEQTVTLAAAYNLGADAVNAVVGAVGSPLSSSVRLGAKILGHCVTCLGSGKCQKCNGRGERYFGKQKQWSFGCVPCGGSGERYSADGGSGLKHGKCPGCIGTGSYMEEAERELAIQHEKERKEAQAKAKAKAKADGKCVECLGGGDSDWSKNGQCYACKGTGVETAEVERALAKEAEEKAKKVEQEKAKAKAEGKCVACLGDGKCGRCSGKGDCVVSDHWTDNDWAEWAMGNRREHPGETDGNIQCVKCLGNGKCGKCRGRGTGR